MSRQRSSQAPPPSRRRKTITAFRSGKRPCHLLIWRVSSKAWPAIVEAGKGETGTRWRLPSKVRLSEQPVQCLLSKSRRMNHLSWNTFFPFAASSAEKGKPIPEDITVPDTMGEQFHLVSEPYAFTPCSYSCCFRINLTWGLRNYDSQLPAKKRNPALWSSRRTKRRPYRWR